MNYDIREDNLSVVCVDFEGCSEVPLDVDFSLPDYCPDIQKILKCQICPNITARSISGDRLNIEGDSIIKIIYMDSDSKKISCYENSMPFSSSIDIKCSPQNAVAITKPRVDYINCRAVSKRKIDVHGAISICAKVISKNTQEISNFISGKDIQQRLECINASDLVGIDQQLFSINENLEFEESKIPPEVIVKSESFLTLNDYKLMPNKVLVKGDLILKFLYIGNLENGDTQKVEYTVPVSQIMDIPGIDEKSEFIISGEILSCEERIDSEGSDENSKKSIAVDARVAVTVLAYRKKEVKIVSDAYSTEYDLTLDKELFKSKSLSSNIFEDFSTKFNIKLPEKDISKIVDIWSDVYSAKLQIKNNKPEINGKMNLCVLALDTENVPFYVERIVEFTSEKLSRDLNLDEAKFDSEIEIIPKSIGYIVSKSGEVDVKVNFKMHAVLYENKEYSMVKEVKSEGVKLKDKDLGITLMIYYASKGEKIWDIARMYYTSVNAIKRENDIEQDIVQTDGMLLIPLK